MANMSMSHKRRKDLARFGKVTTRPTHYGPPRGEVKRNVLEAADHLCAWCGRPAEMVYPRGGGRKDMKAASTLAAWCGFCDPKPDVLGVGWGGLVASRAGPRAPAQPAAPPCPRATWRRCSARTGGAGPGGSPRRRRGGAWRGSPSTPTWPGPKGLSWHAPCKC